MAGRLWPTTRCSGSGPLRRGHGGVEERSEPGGAEEVHAGQNDDDGSPVGLQHRKLSVGSPCPGLAACHWHPTNTTAAPASRSISSQRSSPTSTSGVPSRSCRAVTENRTGAAAGSDGGPVVERGTRSTSRSLMESAPAIMPATTAGTSGVRVRADRVGHLHVLTDQTCQVAVLCQAHHRHQPGAPHQIRLVESYGCVRSAGLAATHRGGARLAAIRARRRAEERPRAERGRWQGAVRPRQ
jgi:hypothetical protein